MMVFNILIIMVFNIFAGPGGSGGWDEAVQPVLRVRVPLVRRR